MVQKPKCFGTADVTINKDGAYLGKCLMCGIEDECLFRYFGKIAEEMRIEKRELLTQKEATPDAM